MTYIEKEFDQHFIVGKLEVGRLNSLNCVLLELVTKHMTVEEHLQLFVGRVNAQLFEAVVTEVLKAVYVENSYRQNSLPSINDTMHYSEIQ